MTMLEILPAHHDLRRKEVIELRQKAVDQITTYMLLLRRVSVTEEDIQEQINRYLRLANSCERAYLPKLIETVSLSCSALSIISAKKEDSFMSSTQESPNPNEYNPGLGGLGARCDLAHMDYDDTVAEVSPNTLSENEGVVFASNVLRNLGLNQDSNPEAGY